MDRRLCHALADTGGRTRAGFGLIASQTSSRLSLVPSTPLPQSLWAAEQGQRWVFGHLSFGK